jgi:methylmalonyl-CoA mutase
VPASFIGVNTYLDPAGSPTVIAGEVIRSTTEEKEFAITTLIAFHQRNEGTAESALYRVGGQYRRNM